MKNQSKFRFIALATAVCASLTACGGTEQTEVLTETYTMAENNQNTTVVSDIYAAPVETVTWGDEETIDTTAATEAVVETVMVSNFDKAGNFNEGHAIIEYSGSSYVIDTAGNIVTELPEKSRDCMIYDGGLIILESKNIVNINGEIVADKEVMGYDDIKGIWYGYIMLRKEVETLERTGYDYCILNTDGSVHVDWAPNPYFPIDELSGRTSDDEVGNGYVMFTGHRRDYCAVYNLETGDCHFAVERNPKYSEITPVSVFEDGKYVTYYNYGYALFNLRDCIEIYDYEDKLIETISYAEFQRDPLDDTFNTTWFYNNYINDKRGNSLYDAYTRKKVTFPFNVDNVKNAELYDCNRGETLYFLELTNNEGSRFYAVADENGNYIVEPSTTRVNTCNEGIYTTENQIYKTDGTLIYTSEIDNVEINAFSDGYCYVDAYRYDFFVDINGNKLEVEFKTE
ncbi:MAG: hypothetical protein IJ035_06600 [Oscillospiraceae bacterium]|nr:hypothetical protein [Oscillospiraceae bacterium]